VAVPTDNNAQRALDMNDLRVENKLQDQDFAKLMDVFSDGSVDSIELLPEIDFGFVKVLPLVISRSEEGYAISTRIFFIDPVGNTVLAIRKIEERGICKSSKKIEFDLKKSSTNCEELGKDIAYGLSLVEETVNYACLYHGEYRFGRFVVDSKEIAKQIEKKEKEKERELRHEKMEPFAMVHADSGGDLRIQSDDLVPLYWEYDKLDLYGGKKAYCMLPRSFVMTLLKCDQSAMIPEEQFDKAGRKVLDELERKGSLKREEIAGKSYYFDLDQNTRTYLTKPLRTGR